MKRYFIVKEYFGIRVYDTKYKKEYYFNNNVAKEIEKILKQDCKYINKTMDNTISSPLKISMNLTKKCNLRCIQCFSNSGKIENNELKTEDIYKLFDDMVENGTFFICLGGGEPFTRKDLFSILEYGKKKQIAISIVTNGSLLTKQILEQLNKQKLDYLWISFEGAKKNHEMLRGKGTYDKAIETLQLIKKYYKGKTAIRMSINKYNIGDMKEILRIAEKYNVDLIRFTPLLEFGRAEGRDLVINQNQYIEFLKLVKQLKSNTTEIIYPNMPNEKIWIGSNGFGCHCGKEAIWITETGDVYPCIFWGDKYKIGNIKENAYSDLWTRSIISSKIETNNVCDSCSNYKLCRAGCRARSLFRYNDLKHVDPLCPLRKNIEEKELL